jgi:hypothetical protein
MLLSSGLYAVLLAVSAGRTSGYPGCARILQLTAAHARILFFSEGLGFGFNDSPFISRLPSRLKRLTLIFIIQLYSTMSTIMV